ncbi:MAG TPA: hypothetical protein VIH08_15665, partial [Blastococcus sp.]
MTTAADDSTVENAFEAYLAGRPVPEEAAGTFQGVAAFAEAVRGTATQPGRPSAALAELLATGLLADQPSPSARTAEPAGTPPSRRAPRIRRRRFAMFIPALVAKLLSAGAVAQAATGAGIVVVAFTGAGAAGILPGPVQESFSSVVSAETAGVTTTPEVTATATTTPAATTTPGATTMPAASTTPGATTTPAAEETATGLTFEQWKQGPAAGQSFGEWVSAGARLGYADGRVISDWAHKRNEDRRAARTSAPATTAPATVEPTGEAEAEDEDDESARGNRGNGNGHGGGEDRGNGHGGG